MKFTVAVHKTAQSAHVHVAGDLDYGTSDLLIDTVSELPAGQPGLQDLHLDFADLKFCDSAGLSALVRIHRLTSAEGIGLHLDQRPAHLDRILHITGLLDFLTTPAAAQESDESDIG